MAQSFIILPDDSSNTGKKLQTFDNTISLNDVYAEAVAVVDSTGAEKATGSNPLRVDPTGTTVQPVSGTVTANIGTTGGVALDTSVNGLLVGQGSTTSGENGPLVQAAVTTSAPSYTTAKTSPLSLNTSGGLRVDGSGVTQPVSGTITANAGSGTFNIQANASVNVAQVAGAAPSLSNPLPVELSDGTNLLGTSGHPVRVDPIGTTTQPVSIAPATSGGTSVFHLVSAGSTNANNIKASAGQIYGWSIFNNAAYTVFVKFYNTAGTPTAGTGVIQTVGVQAGLPNTYSSVFGIPYGTGIGITITKGIADSDATAVLASDCVVEVYYK